MLGSAQHAQIYASSLDSSLRSRSHRKRKAGPTPMHPCIHRAEQICERKQRAEASFSHNKIPLYQHESPQGITRTLLPAAAPTSIFAFIVGGLGTAPLSSQASLAPSIVILSTSLTAFYLTTYYCSLCTPKSSRTLGEIYDSILVIYELVGLSILSVNIDCFYPCGLAGTITTIAS